VNVRKTIDGPSGLLEVAFEAPDAPQSIALICHPHPLFGGTMDNKVVTTVAKALLELNAAVLRFNFRGVGKSEGVWDEGRGEIYDAHAALSFARETFGLALPLRVAGFSFGGFVAARLMASVPQTQQQRGVLIAPAVTRFAVGDVVLGTHVIHGETDDVVPLTDVLAWAKTQSIPVQVIPGAGHFFHGQLIALREAVKSLCQS
jgi:uncharacterized protein